MTDAVDEKTDVENATTADESVDPGASAEEAAQDGDAPAAKAEASASDDAGAAQADETSAEADAAEDAGAASPDEASAGTSASDGEDADEEDPWAAALAEQEAAEAAKPEAPEEPAPASVRGGSAEVFQPLAGAATNTAARDLDIVMNIPVKLNVELGRTKISIRQLLELAQGSVLELDGLAGDPMDILINGYLIAQGEVVVVEERYGIRITDIITPTERVEKLNR